MGKQACAADLEHPNPAAAKADAAYGLRGARGKAEPFGSSNLPIPTIKIQITQ